MYVVAPAPLSLIVRVNVLEVVDTGSKRAKNCVAGSVAVRLWFIGS
jgi:hypothetical protein